MNKYAFTIATEPAEFEEIHRLNYQTFVAEIPQHEPNPERRLVDRFHAENTYIVCKTADRVIGMVCVRDRRPFSVDLKIGPFEALLPVTVARPSRPCEIRLLAIDPRHRKGRIIFGLFERLLRLGLERSYDFAVMSGRPANFRLYAALGFRPFGPLTGAPDALFQPMYATAELFLLAQGRKRLVGALPEMLRQVVRDRLNEQPHESSTMT